MNWGDLFLGGSTQIGIVLGTYINCLIHDAMNHGLTRVNFLLVSFIAKINVTQKLVLWILYCFFLFKQLIY